jgi:hypothetical protein
MGFVAQRSAFPETLPAEEAMSSGNFFSELKRRNVYKVAVAYAGVGWLIVQIATQIFPFLEIPNWIVRLVIALIAIGFPIALVIAWAFEATPQGIKRTEVADAMPATARDRKKHAWIYVVVIAAAVSVTLFFIGRYTAGTSTAPRQSETATVLPAKSIAVLPFESLSEQKGNAYLVGANINTVTGGWLAYLNVIQRQFAEALAVWDTAPELKSALIPAGWPCVWLFRCSRDRSPGTEPKKLVFRLKKH